MKVHVSKMTGKLHGLLAISTNTLTNHYCQTQSVKSTGICSHCYSISMLEGYRKTCVSSFERNSETLSTSLIPESELPAFKPGQLVRFSAHGELINVCHLDNLMAICRKSPGALFALFTKRADIVERWLENDNETPINCRLVFSVSELNKIPTSVRKNFHYDFTVYNKTLPEESNTVIHCHASACFDCRVCYTDISKHPIHIVESLK